MSEPLADYEGSSLRLLLGIVAALAGPAGALFGPIENAVLERYKRIQAERLCELVRHLEIDAVTLQQATQTDESIHAIVTVIKASQRTRMSEKQRAFAKLLSQYLKTGEFGKNARKFEDFFRILDDLTETELTILLVLNGFDLANADDGRPQRWQEARKKIEEVLGAEVEEATARLSRLCRTGLCIQLDVWDEPTFSASPLYSQFISYLELGNYRSL